MPRIGFLPEEDWNRIKELVVIPTVDLIVKTSSGVVMVRRRIAPYKGLWALPGLRMYKGERIAQTIERIARDELGFAINGNATQLIGQQTVKFRSDHDRQDLSTCYLIEAPVPMKCNCNSDHFTAMQICATIPTPIGGLYRRYLRDIGMEE